VLLLAPQVEDRLLRVLDPLVEPAALRLARLEPGLLAVERGLAALRLRAQAGERRLERAERLGELPVLQGAPGQAQVAQAVPEPLVAHRLRRLAPQASDLAGDLADHVGDPRQVLVGQRELAHGLPALALVLGDPRRLLEDRAPLLGLGGEDLVDLALGHDRVAGPAYAGVHEELMDVLQPARLAVEQVFALAVPVDPPRDLDLVEFAAELLLALRQEHRDLAHLGGPARVGPLEDDVLHLSAAKRLRALLPEHPADRVGDVGLAAAVGPDHGGHAGLEHEGRWIGE
jgi:hypothetical protein